MSPNHSYSALVVGVCNCITCPARVHGAVSGIRRLQPVLHDGQELAHLPAQSLAELWGELGARTQDTQERDKDAKTQKTQRRTKTQMRNHTQTQRTRPRARYLSLGVKELRWVSIIVRIRVLHSSGVHGHWRRRRTMKMKIFTADVGQIRNKEMKLGRQEEE